MFCPWPVLAGQEDTAEQGLDPQELEVTGRDPAHQGIQRLLEAGDGQARIACRRQDLERAALAPQVDEVAAADRAAHVRLALLGLEDHLLEIDRIPRVCEPSTHLAILRVQRCRSPLIARRTASGAAA